MSESSVPSIRARATPRERRAVPYSPPSAATNRDTQRALGTAPSTFTGKSGADLPALLGMSKAQRETLARQAIETSGLRQGLQAIDTEGASTLEALEIASLGIPGVGVAGLGGKAAVRGGLSLAARLRGAGAAAKESQQVVRTATRTKTRQTAARAVEKVPKPIRKGARAASYPVRQHPVLSAGAAPIAAEVPGGDVQAALEGTGRAAAFLGGAGDAVRSGGLPGRALADALSLPAMVAPSLYLTGRAGVKAAQGDSSEAEALWQGFLDESALPPLVTGDLKEAGRRANQHPLYAALEVVGAGAAAGRVAGSAKRGGKAPEQREPLSVYGDITIPRGRYSRNAITETVQRMRDRKLAGRGFEASPRQKARYLDQRLDRTVFAGEAARKTAVRDAQEAMEAIGSMAGQGNADAVALAVQRIARNPETAIADLQRYRAALIAEQSKLAGGMLRANQATVARVEKAIKHNDPEALVAAANEFAGRQRPVQEGLHDRGIYDPEQTERASAIGFMRFHEGVGYGKPAGDGRAASQMLDSEGNPLTTEAIRGALTRQGAEPPGFISNRPGELGRGAYFRPSTERPSGVGPRTSGKAVLQGLSNTDFDAVTRQFMSGVSRLEQAKGFDAIGRGYGLSKPGGGYFANTSQARRAADSPADFGMSLPDVPGGWVPWRVAPWPTRTPELEAARRHGRPAEGEPDTPEVAPGQGEAFAAQVVERALADGDGPVILMPKIIADRLREHFKAKSPFERTGEAITGQYKSAILPTSPGWFAGNVADIWGVRTPIARVSPRDIIDGRGLERLIKHEMSPDDAIRVMESVVPGGFYGTRRSQPHRTYEQFVGHRVEPFWRAAAALRHAPGAETIGNLYARYRDMVFDVENRFIERTPQYGALAKHARSELGMTRRQFRRAVRDMEPALMDFVRGFRRQDNVDRAARSIEAIYGNWGKNGPDARRFLTTWAPFWMWLRAATKFAVVTMPRDHPVLTSIIAASQEMTREERQKLGLDFGADEAVPDHLQGGIPTSDGGVIGISNLTTFGFFNNLLENSASMAAPQLLSGAFAAFGLDWKGDRLVDAEGRPASQERAAVAAAAAVGESFVPFLNVVKRTVDKGFEGVLPVRKTDPGLIDYLRSLSESRQISVPVGGSGSGSGAGGIDYNSAFGTSGSGIDYGSAFGGN